MHAESQYYLKHASIFTLYGVKKYVLSSEQNSMNKKHKERKFSYYFLTSVSYFFVSFLLKKMPYAVKFNGMANDLNTNWSALLRKYIIWWCSLPKIYFGKCFCIFIGNTNLNLAIFLNRVQIWFLAKTAIRVHCFRLFIQKERIEDNSPMGVKKLHNDVIKH